jgi:hypothetical protein
MSGWFGESDTVAEDDDTDDEDDQDPKERLWRSWFGPNYGSGVWGFAQLRSDGKPWTGPVRIKAGRGRELASLHEAGLCG